MIYEKIDLKNEYPFLKEMESDAVVELYIQEHIKEMQFYPKKPCMVVCPGGGYGFCSRREAEPIAIKFMNMGFNVFVISYSVAPKRYPLAVLEVASLFKYIKQNGEKWNCDIEKIGICGFSAGGHLTAYYSTCYDIDIIKEKLGETFRPTASVLCYPVISADKKIAHQGSFLNLLGEYPEGERLNEFSTDMRVNENTPPAFIWHTASDNVVPVENSLRYAAALSRYKIPFSLHIYPFGYHGLSTVDDTLNTSLEENMLYAKEWIYELEKWVKLTF